MIPKKSATKLGKSQFATFSNKDKQILCENQHSSCGDYQVLNVNGMK